MPTATGTADEQLQTLQPPKTPKVESQGYTPSTFSVKPDQTVETRVNNLIGQDSSLMQQARRRADEQMNQRGLLNSPMAIGAAQDAVISAATPIAMADAATYERAGTNTTNAENAAKAFTAGAGNTASLAESDYATRSLMQTMSDKAALERTQADNDTRALIQSMSDKAALTRTELTSDTQLKLGAIDQETKKFLGQLDSDNRQLLQTNQGLSQMYQETVKNIAAIATSDTMTAQAKRDATQAQLNLLNQALQASSTVAGTPQADIASLKLADYFAQQDPVQAAQQQALAGLNPQAILQGDKAAVMAAIQALGREQWDGLLNVYERGAPFSGGTTQQLGLLAEAVKGAQ